MSVTTKGRALGDKQLPGPGKKFHKSKPKPELKPANAATKKVSGLAAGSGTGPGTGSADRLGNLRLGGSARKATLGTSLVAQAEGTVNYSHKEKLTQSISGKQDVEMRMNVDDGASPAGQEQPGILGWIAEYWAARPGLEVLQQRVDSWMAEYDARVEQARTDREAVAAEDDGWTLVSRKPGKKRSRDASGGVGVAAVAAPVAERQRKKAKKETLVDFYRFQAREARRNELLELQEKFEEDKKRIARLKEARKFKPF